MSGDEVRPTYDESATPRCWQTKWRDRLAWWAFRHIAHPAVARTAVNHYRWGRDCVSVEWTTEGGSHGHYKRAGSDASAS